LAPNIIGWIIGVERNGPVVAIKDTGSEILPNDYPDWYQSAKQNKKFFA